MKRLKPRTAMVGQCKNILSQLSLSWLSLARFAEEGKKRDTCTNYTGGCCDQ